MKNSINPNSWKVLVLLLAEIARDKMITQEQIAEKTGLLQTNISRIFLLKYRPRIDTFLAICDAIGINFFIEDKSGKLELNILFEKAMTELFRRTSDFPEN